MTPTNKQGNYIILISYHTLVHMISKVEEST